MLSARRFREHAGLFGALMGVVALVSGLGVGVVGFLGHSADEGVRTGLESRAGADRALRVSLALDPDAARQDDEVRAAIARSFQGIALDIDRTVGSRVAVALVNDDGVADIAHRSQVLSIPGLPDRATLVDGSWPSGPGEVTLQVNGADRLGVEVGGQLRIDKTIVTVAGTWVVDDALDPRWLGDPLITEGLGDTDFGPVVIDEALWPELDTDPRARWTLVPEVPTLTASDLAPAVAAWNGINTAWRGQVSSQLVTLEKTGRFKRSALELGTRVDGLTAIQPVVLILLVAIMLVTLAELGRLLTTTRDSEIALLWSRGASALDIGTSTATEAAIAAVAGAAAGTGVAIGALRVLVSPDSLGALGLAVIAIPLSAVVAAVLVVAGSALRSARRQTVRDPSDAAGRARRLAGPGLAILAVGSAGVSVWQLQLYGSPLTPTAEGGTDVDPIAVVAPALTLVAVVVIALILFPRVATLAEVASRRAGLLRILAARTVARRLQLVAAPIVVVAVAAATLVVAATYSATWSDSFERTSSLRAGAPLHISTGFLDVRQNAIDVIRASDGVTAAAPVDLQTLQIGSDTGSIVAATPSTIANVSTAASGTFDRAGAAEAARVDVPGPDLPSGTGRLTLASLQSGFEEAPTAALQVMDGYGVLREIAFGGAVDLGPDATTSTDEREFRRVSYTATVPAELASAPGPWHVLAVDIGISGQAVTGTATGRFVIDGIAADDTELELDPFWLPESPILQYDPLLAPGYDGHGFTVGTDALSVRMMPTFDDAYTDRTTIPVVVSQRLADMYELGVGDIVTFSLDDASERTTSSIAMITPAVPGAELETAVLLDLGYVLHQQLRLHGDADAPRDFWVDTPDAEKVVTALRPELPANTRMQSSGDPAGRTVLGAAAAALWLGALGCLVLATITVVAVVRAQVRSRRLDVVVLRAIGLGARDQARIRRRELALVLGFGMLSGLLAGTCVAFLTVPQLARAAVVDPYTTVPTPLGADLAMLAAGLGVLVLALVVISALYSARVALQARTAIGAEEAG